MFMLPTGLFGLQERFDESDNILVRGARNVTDTLSDRLRTSLDRPSSVFVRARVYVCVCVCMYVCVYVWCVCLHV